MKVHNKIIIYTDGASRGNPGESAASFIILDEKENILYQHASYIGKNTNNVAEYMAMIKALDTAKIMFKAKEIECYSDSEVMVKQINGEYKIKAEHLRELNDKIKKLISKLGNVTFSNVRRTHPWLAKVDYLGNECLDRQATGGVDINQGL